MSESPPDDGKQQTLPEIADISDDDVVVRRIPAADLKNIGAGRLRVSKAAFSASSWKSDPEQGMSVDLLSTLIERNVDPESLDYAPEHDVLMTLKVRDLRNELKLTVVRRPKPNNPAHCNVLGVRGNIRKKLLNLAGWLRRPRNVFKSEDEADQG